MTVAGKRYEYIAESLLAWIGPAFRGIDADLKNLETSGGGGGGEPAVTDLTAVYNTAKA